MTFAAAMLIALAIDALFGWPPWLYARIGHPVTWIGRLIASLDRRWNVATATASVRRAAGVGTALSVIAITVAVAATLAAALPDDWSGSVLAGVLAWPLVAGRSLHDHVAAVATPLSAGDLDAARSAVAMIVGRDPQHLDPAGVSRAALESLAENSSDGIVAPLLWGAILGLPGIAAYKAINTMDSMIGHHTPRHQVFGWAAARIDDAANLLPARLTGGLLAFSSSQVGPSLASMWRDAHRHRSPNAGWPEAAMAGALGVRLSGPRIYGDRISDEPWINHAARDPEAADLSKGLALYRRAMLVLGVILAVWATLATVG
ncbi:MAG: adenosylcobinamide-phosphate synthase CbiB [Hyphomicrobium sp.]